MGWLGRCSAADPPAGERPSKGSGHRERDPEPEEPVPEREHPQLGHEDERADRRDADPEGYERPGKRPPP